VTGLTDSDAGISSVRRWSAYGKLLSGSSEPIGYFWTGNTGSRVYQSLGLNDNRARHYGRNIKQWITRDPLWPSELPYAYVGGNPVTFIDPLGAYKKEEGPCKSTIITPEKGDRVGVVVGKPKPGSNLGTMISGGDAISQFRKPGEDCIAINGGFFGTSPYDDGKPSQPIEDVQDWCGRKYKGADANVKGVPDLIVQTPGGYIYGRPTNKPGGANPGKVPRTGACTDSKGNLLFLMVVPNVDFKGLGECMSKRCKSPNKIVMLDGGGSTQIYETDKNGKPVRIYGGPRNIHNWIVICE
jgi:RHS repeat-associated protein